ncbi:SMP-30/gluconolactonase/LRE family protein [Deinococcus sp. Arct2-2]|uniref:SMP-30/gluconolactonase/LRE family protein n=1 Tax=Deinococcus sp. Arct2-2 TaxID=2568653 RepID=UPI0010A4E098|nr:SMP-30/gluconolactonase/LRE family protein [Deinococcus sp. Arct2-2]THF67730.1 SMP-30/gluconolactonase/LRE family protein [Deinococcus sp. Arct2-2]
MPAPNIKEADPRINGLVARQNGEIFVAVRSNSTELAGVWRLTAGRFQKFASLPAGAGLNGMADDGRFLYIADDLAGRLYRITPQGQGEVWIEDARLAPQGQSAYGFPVYGANGVKVHGGEVYVSNSSTGTLWRISIAQDGTPGALTAFLPTVHFHNIDDFAFDGRGNLYFATVVDHTVERVSPQGEITVLLQRTDGLDMPTAVAFGETEATRSTLFVTSGSFYSPPGTVPHANVLKFETDQRGESILR